MSLGLSDSQLGISYQRRLILKEIIKLLGFGCAGGESRYGMFVSVEEGEGSLACFMWNHGSRHEKEPKVMGSDDEVFVDVRPAGVGLFLGHMPFICV